MSSTALKRIVAETPVDWWTRLRLSALVRKARARSYQYTFEHLLDKAAPIAPEILSIFLAELVERGLVRRVIRVESPGTGGGLGDFDAIEALPAQIDDGYGHLIPVTPDMLRVIYKFSPRGSDA